jgi:hypothetical protein
VVEGVQLVAEGEVEHVLARMKNQRTICCRSLTMVCCPLMEMVSEGREWLRQRLRSVAFAAII